MTPDPSQDYREIEAARRANMLNGAGIHAKKDGRTRRNGEDDT